MQRKGKQIQPQESKPYQKFTYPRRRLHSLHVYPSICLGTKRDEIFGRDVDRLKQLHTFFY